MSNVNDELSVSQLVRRDFNVALALMSGGQREVFADVIQKRSWEFEGAVVHTGESQFVSTARAVRDRAHVVLEGSLHQRSPVVLYQECIDVAASAMALAEMALRFKEAADE